MDGSVGLARRRRLFELREREVGARLSQPLRVPPMDPGALSLDGCELRVAARVNDAGASLEEVGKAIGRLGHPVGHLRKVGPDGRPSFLPDLGPEIAPVAQAIAPVGPTVALGGGGLPDGCEPLALFERSLALIGQPVPLVGRGVALEGDRVTSGGGLVPDVRVPVALLGGHLPDIGPVRPFVGGRATHLGPEFALVGGGFPLVRGDVPLHRQRFAVGGGVFTLVRLTFTLVRLAVTLDARRGRRTLRLERRGVGVAHTAMIAPNDHRSERAGAQP